MGSTRGEPATDGHGHPGVAVVAAAGRPASRHCGSSEVCHMCARMHTAASPGNLFSRWPPLPRDVSLASIALATRLRRSARPGTGAATGPRPPQAFELDAHLPLAPSAD